ncbi:MAG: hypothetical protein EOO92_13965 [Pedobacter sp.]|nr:MAG: hypothetical protein EOO92_13965 [Pedobacter sp.]
MDRLIIESALSDVSEIFLVTDDEGNDNSFAIVLGFKASNTDQILNAFSGLKAVSVGDDIQLVICKTQVTGIYDLEIKTARLDEPIRIMNKAITSETLGAIEDRVNKNVHIVLTTNVSEEDNWIRVSATHIKDCERA